MSLVVIVSQARQRTGRGKGVLRRPKGQCARATAATVPLVGVVLPDGCLQGIMRTTTQAESPQGAPEPATDDATGMILFAVALSHEFSRLHRILCKEWLV